MPKHLVKLSRFGGQFRVTLPRLLIKEMSWSDVEFVIMDNLGDGALRVRRFVDREGLKVDGKTDPPGPD